MRHVVRLACLLVLGAILVGGLGRGADARPDPGPEDRDAARETSRAELLGRALDVLRARLDGQLGLADLLVRQGRAEEALAVYQGMEALYERELSRIERLLAAVRAPAAEPQVEVRVGPGPEARRSASADVFDAAVEEGLRWLAAHQSADGGWEAAGFDKWCDQEPVPSGPDGLGKSLYDVGVTGLALCAFLSAGHTQRSGDAFAPVVQRGLRYLMNRQDVEGCFGVRVSQHFIYNHAAASLAIVEAYALTASPILRGPAQKALDFIALARNPYFGWRYGIKPGDNDTSVTAWMVAVLASARNINLMATNEGSPPPLEIDDGAFTGALAWVDKMTEPDFGRVGYIQRGTGSARPQELIDRFPAKKSEAMTAAGIFIRLLAGQSPDEVDVIEKGIGRIAELPPTWNPNDGSIDLYYWYYGTHVMERARNRHAGGDAQWKRWRAALADSVLPHQRRDTDLCGYRGSWDPIGPWGPDGGRVYSTALLTMCMAMASR